MLAISKRILTKAGYSAYIRSKVITVFLNDLLYTKEISFKQKIWAYNRGFLSSRVKTYGINELNYKSHMPDFDYYKLHPINGSYSTWIDDKLSMKYMLNPFNEYLPEYYFQLDENEILKLMDCPINIDPNISGIIKLIQEKGSIALKLIYGSLGEGFYKLSYLEDNYYINDKQVKYRDIEILLSNLKGYLVTEYITSHDALRKIYDVTPNTLRVQLIKNINEKPKIVGSLIRFGTKKSGILETPLAGGVRAGVDIKSGKIFNPHIISNQSLKEYKQHPDTNRELEIVLPKWEEIKLKVEEISNYTPQLSYLGFDIIITNQGFKIIEINSLTSIAGISYYYPFFENEYSKHFFITKFEERPDKFKRILTTLNEK